MDKNAVLVKVYIVLQRVNLPGPDGNNVRVLDVLLNLRSAEAVVEAIPGTWIERRLARKYKFRRETVAPE